MSFLHRLSNLWLYSQNLVRISPSNNSCLFKQFTLAAIETTARSRCDSIVSRFLLEEMTDLERGVDGLSRCLPASRPKPSSPYVPHCSRSGATTLPQVSCPVSWARKINIVCNHFCVEQYIELLDGFWRNTVLHTVSLQIAALNLN